VSIDVGRPIDLNGYSWRGRRPVRADRRLRADKNHPRAIDDLV